MFNIIYQLDYFKNNFKTIIMKKKKRGGRGTDQFNFYNIPSATLMAISSHTQASTSMSDMHRCRGDQSLTQSNSTVENENHSAVQRMF